jgi:hypothetical protein
MTNGDKPGKVVRKSADTPNVPELRLLSYLLARRMGGGGPPLWYRLPPLEMSVHFSSNGDFTMGVVKVIVSDYRNRIFGKSFAYPCHDAV